MAGRRRQNGLARPTVPARPQRREDGVRLHRVDGAAPQAVGRQDQVADRCRRSPPPGSAGPTPMSPTTPPIQPISHATSAITPPVMPERRVESSRPSDSRARPFGADVDDQLDRMRRHVAGRPIDRGHLEERRAGGVDRDEHREPEPLADHDLAAAHRPREHRKQQAALDLARDERSGDDGGAQREHAAVHERDDDQELRGDQRRPARAAAACRRCRSPS